MKTESGKLTPQVKLTWLSVKIFINSFPIHQLITREDFYKHFHNSANKIDANNNAKLRTYLHLLLEANYIKRKEWGVVCRIKDIPINFKSSNKYQNIRRSRLDIVHKGVNEIEAVNLYKQSIIYKARLENVERFLYK